MIVPMLKYTFLVFHREYEDFLIELNRLGLVHIAERDVELSEETTIKIAALKKYEQAINFLEKRENETAEKPGLYSAPEILDDLTKKQKELEELEGQLESLTKAAQKALPWGNFSPQLIEQLKNERIHIHFYSLSKKKYNELEQNNLPIAIISETGSQVLFMYIKRNEEDIELDAEELQLPPLPYAAIQKQISETAEQIKAINETLDSYANNSVYLLEEEKTTLIRSLEFDKVIRNTNKEAEDKLMVLEGWVPHTKTPALNQFLKESDAVYFSRRAKPDDKIPVLLKNNRFSKLFEPIGSMFSLPDYAELDLTVFFAPFFMLFFGFCLGDAGYGLLFVIGGGLYKLKAKPEFKPYLSLIQFLGVATILFGAISGTFFGINLIETNFALTDQVRHLFLDPNKMFNLSLILGGIQIIFGLFIKATNQTKQFGFSYALATYGWLIILIGSIAYVLLSGAGIIPKNKNILYGVIALGGFFVLFFSDPGVNIFARLGKGVWDVYSTVTGIFGDLLSYIRLFALGLSSAILGFVINDIGLQILGSSKLLGPVFFVVFLLLGHTLNILISSLGSFVHPMRLTFVEFYKNAGFKGGGEEYKPFGRIKDE
ncbi:V/A-type H+-transporting ATPase subunit I [Draconibacterium orientale]|uniref:ATP synthase subunit I n=1 Tax=Draconibacterium orientale TaxID=1168034 RepID=X5DHV8_9BACT|nr:V-type ATPase 116kDa subunit family protein [Draconibacterium orientale]AHW60674.1 ATP synthase subunit I [Draconibacterium orientale]SET78049.1 V/A-type H+-transporting ATPase subunit I [Draconibacterium orientale]